MYCASRITPGPPLSYQTVGDPRQLWPREADLHRWLLDHPDQLAQCLGIPQMQFVLHEAVIGEQRLDTDALDRWRWTGGLRLDLAARDVHGRLIVIEAQLGDGDHSHLGQLVTYASVMRADVAVWVVAHHEPPFYEEHLAALAELNEAFSGRRRFYAVAASVESQPRAGVAPDGPLRPRLRRADPSAGSA